jgi:hypothetical protein
MSGQLEQDTSIYHNYGQWANSVREYEYNKKNLAWGSNPSPKIITHKIVKEKENIFNPISQLYHNPQINSSLRERESKVIKDSIAKNFDRVLRNEQTFDIINLKDKLKGFEKHPDYPIIKQDPRKINLEQSRANYNIVSNITLDKHNFLPPEQRPTVNDEFDIKSIQPQKIKLQTYKDYDVITNKYKLNHDEKVKTEKEISKYAAANNYWKKRDYDLIQGKFIDQEKENNFINKRKDIQEQWGSDKAHHEYNKII